MSKTTTCILLTLLGLFFLGLWWLMDDAPEDHGTAASLQGMVEDGDQGPIAAEVRLRCADEGIQKIRAGEDGLFEFEGLPEGSCRVMAQAEGYLAGMREVSARLDVEILAGERLVDVRLLLYRPNRIAGQVLGPAGPVPNAKIGLFVIQAPDVEQAYSEDLELVTSADGRFHLEGLGPGTLQVLAEAEGLAMGRSREFDLRSGTSIEDLRIVLSPLQAIKVAEAPRLIMRRDASEQDSDTGSLSGRVLTSGSGKSVRIFDLRMLAFREKDGELGKLPRRAQRRIADGEGRFRLEGLEPGQYSLEIRAPGRTSSRLESVRVEAGRLTDLGDLFLSGPGSVRGRVVDGRTGEGLPGVNVGALGVGGRSVRSQSDADGNFRLTQLPADLVSVGLAKHGYLRELLSGISVQAGQELDLGEVSLESSQGKRGSFAYAGMGASLKQEGGRLLVGDVFEGAPAAQVGLVTGSQIMTVDGQDVSALGLRGAVERIRGRDGSMVSLEVILPGESSSRLLHIQRGRVISPARRRP
ncbi:MAG: carboxypeptidase regulatory-like domain-containing protein [Deltaproteobacteria bacterium]|nr:carboxypeptidase regulatory-like domain-containing protein [Deltaproteobacteria bacterium]